MPAEFWSDVSRMAVCGGLVAAGAIPVGLAAWLASGRKPVLPRPAKWSVPWGGAEVLILFVFSWLLPAALVAPLLTSIGFFPAVYGPDTPAETWEPMRSVWAGALSAPFLLLSVWIVVRSAWPEWRPEPVEPAARAAGGIATWLALHPIVAVVHFTVAAVFLAQGWQPDSHPLETKFKGPRPLVDDVLLVVQAAIMAPLMEELLFRGAIIPWLLAKPHRAAIVLRAAAALAAMLSVQMPAGGEFSFRPAPAIFAVILLMIGEVVLPRRNRHRRTDTAIWSSAALFAVVHTPVWPTPIPLFVLGLGLGWLAVRTHGYLAPTIVHGLFNLVSVLFVLRG